MPIKRKSPRSAVREGGVVKPPWDEAQEAHGLPDLLEIVPARRLGRCEEHHKATEVARISLARDDVHHRAPRGHDVLHDDLILLPRLLRLAL